MIAPTAQVNQHNSLRMSHEVVKEGNSVVFNLPSYVLILKGVEQSPYFVTLNIFGAYDFWGEGKIQRDIHIYQYEGLRASSSGLTVLKGSGLNIPSEDIEGEYVPTEFAGLVPGMREEDLIEDLMYRYAPEVRLYSKDIHLPSSVHWYLDRCKLVGHYYSLSLALSRSLRFISSFSVSMRERIWTTLLLSRLWVLHRKISIGTITISLPPC